MVNITSESQFENHVRQIIQQEIIEKKSDLILFQNKKAVDILICRNSKPALFFIEIKYHKKSSGRLGFGQAAGVGFQPEILLSRPNYFETNLRWIIGAEDIESYYLLNNAEILNYIQGGEVGEKYNGIKKDLFKKHNAINRQELIIALTNWFDE